MSHAHDQEPLVTLFAIPKPFRGLAAIQQRNALASWTGLGRAADVILCGDDEGVAEAAEAAGVRHLPTIARNAWGTPLVNAAFDQVSQLARTPLLCYLNADIILLSDFVATLRRIRLASFLLCGQRWDLNLD